jgi:P27 family predicted phage terminase small subunit
MLQRNRLLSEADLDALSVYCQICARWLDAEQHLEDESTTTAKSGDTQVSAWHTIDKSARADLLKISDRLELNPSARSRISRDPDGRERRPTSVGRCQNRVLVIFPTPSTNSSTCSVVGSFFLS